MKLTMKLNLEKTTQQGQNIDAFAVIVIRNLINIQ
jgi:hypothetical protein